MTTDTPCAEPVMALLAQHRSIRHYDPTRALDEAWVDELLHAALHGSSSSGNLNLSVVKTTDAARKSHLRGTTLHSMGAIAEYLVLPENCLPVTSLVVGWPAEAPTQRDRLPARAWIHNERYQRPTPADIDDRFGEREVYDPDQFAKDSAALEALLRQRGFL